MVWGVLEKCPSNPTVLVGVNNYPNRSPTIPKTSSLGGEQVAGQFIKPPQKLPGLKVNVFMTTFELVEFFKNRDRNGNIVLFEVPDTVGVVQDDIGIQHEKLTQVIGHGHLFLRGHH